MNQPSNTTRSKIAKERRQKFLRKLKFYSSAAGLGAFACSAPAQGAISFTDVVPDLTITNSLSTTSEFIDINADGVGPAEFSIIAPGAQNQIRVGGAPLDSTVVDDERGGHVGLGCGFGTCGAPAPIGAGEGNQVLSLFGNPGSIRPTDTNPGYYVESVPAGFPISRTSLSPSFYADVAANFYAGYGGFFINRIGSDQYVGLQWDFDGTDDVRYGWAQINVSPPNNDPGPAFLSATLTAYAFEMTPNTPIAAGAVPEPGSLALLAAGGGGLALARRRRRRA